MDIRYIKETNHRACKLSNSTQYVLPDLHLYRDVQRENKIRREETDGVRYILQKLWSNRVLDEEEMQKKTYKPKGLLQQNLPFFSSPFLPPSQYLWRCRWPARCEFSFILINNMSIYLFLGYASTSDSDVSFPWTHASLLNIASSGFGTRIAWLKSGNQNDLVYSSSVLKDSNAPSLRATCAVVSTSGKTGLPSRKPRLLWVYLETSRLLPRQRELILKDTQRHFKDNQCHLKDTSKTLQRHLKNTQRYWDDSNIQKPMIILS